MLTKSPAHILVVEDEQSIADSITYALRSEGFAATHVTTGAEALVKLDQNQFQLAILDVGLPDRNGFDLCRDIKATHATLPVIFLTARSGEIDRVVGLEIGANDYLAKPFSPRELTARVRSLLRLVSALQENKLSPAPATNPEESISTNSPFHIDEERCVINYFATPLNLSRQEYRILSILINRPGRVYTRDKLMEMAWEQPDSSLDRTVDTHIKTLRHKLKSIKPDIEAIITHRGLGYSLKESW